MYSLRYPVYIEKYFAKICNINLATDRQSACGVDIANSRKIFFMYVPRNHSTNVLSHRLLIAIINHHFIRKLI